MKALIITIPDVLLFVLPVVLIFAYGVFFIKRHRSRKKNRNVLLDEFRSTEFSGEDQLAWYIAHDLMGAGGFPDCVVYKVDQKDKVCRQIAAYGPKNPAKGSILNPINIPFGRGIVGHVAANGKTEKIDDTTRDARYVPDDDVRYSELSVPVLIDEKAVLVIDSEHMNHGWFKEGDVVYVSSIAAIAADKIIQLEK